MWHRISQWLQHSYTFRRHWYTRATHNYINRWCRSAFGRLADVNTLCIVCMMCNVQCVHWWRTLYREHCVLFATVSSSSRSHVSAVSLVVKRTPFHSQHHVVLACAIYNLLMRYSCMTSCCRHSLAHSFVRSFVRSLPFSISFSFPLFPSWTTIAFPFLLANRTGMGFSF